MGCLGWPTDGQVEEVPGQGMSGVNQEEGRGHRSEERSWTGVKPGVLLLLCG